MKQVFFCAVVFIVQQIKHTKRMSCNFSFVATHQPLDIPLPILICISFRMCYLLKLLFPMLFNETACVIFFKQTRVTSYMLSSTTMLYHALILHQTCIVNIRTKTTKQSFLCQYVGVVFFFFLNRCMQFRVCCQL